MTNADSENPLPKATELSLTIGPSRSGKTSLLGAIRFQSIILASDNSRPVFVVKFPAGEEGDKARRLMDAIETRTYATGQFGWDGTQQISSYRFTIRETVTTTTPGGLFSSSVKMTESVRHHNFAMFDGPGGAILGGSGDQQAKGEPGEALKQTKELVKHGKDSVGLICCLDSADESDETKTIFREKLASALDLLADSENRPAKLQQFAFVLTKADKHFSMFGKEASDRAMNSDPWERVRLLVGRAGWGAIKNYLIPNVAKIACGWASAYGFLPDGCANYVEDDEGNGRLRSFDAENPHRSDWETWEPFRILDPFLFVATGDLHSMKPYPF